MTVLEMKVEALMKCVDQEKFNAEFAAISGTAKTTEYIEDILRREICNHLVVLGTPAHIKGYRYLEHAVKLAVMDETLIDAITFELYPTVAKQFNTTPSRVERAIRHAIEVTWDRGDWDVLGKYFGNTVSNTKGKPTNGEFIARMANIVRDQLK